MDRSSPTRADMHPMAIRVLKILVFGALTCVCSYLALFATVGGGGVTGVFLAAMCEEPVVEADANVVNPANEGKLVRIKGEAVFTGEAVDPITGVKAAVPLMRRDNYYYICKSRRILEERIFAAPDLKIGAYPIVKLNERDGSYMGGFSNLTKDKVQLTPPADNRTLAPVKENSDATFILNDSNGETIAVLAYHYYSTTPMYILGRQMGGCLDMSDPDASTFHHLSTWSEKRRTCNHGSEVELFVAALGLFVIDFLLLLPLSILCLRTLLAQLLPGWNIIRLHPVDLGLRLGSATVLGGAGCFIVFAYERDAGTYIGYPLALFCIVYAAAQLCRTVQLWREAGKH